MDLWHINDGGKPCSLSIFMNNCDWGMWGCGGGAFSFEKVEGGGWRRKGEGVLGVGVIDGHQTEKKGRERGEVSLLEVHLTVVLSPPHHDQH